MNITLGRAVVFIVILWIIAAFIHNLVNNVTPLVNLTQSVSAQPVQNAPTPPSVPNPAPIVSISKIWPDGAMPTKIIHIPDPQEPTKGLFEINLRQGDDLELDFDPFWIMQSGNASLPKPEVAIDSGDGFETQREFEENRSTSGTNAWWLKKRIVRMRLAAGQPDTAYSYTVSKRLPENPLPPVPAQVYENLSVEYAAIHGQTDGKVLVTLIFRNTSPVNTIAVAMYIGANHNLKSSLACSDGTPYVINANELTGINALFSNPQYLTSIEPRQELKASFKFEPRWNRSDSFTSFTMQAEVVVNNNYSDGEYNNYRTFGGYLPPYCKVINVTFDIPARVNKNN